MIGSALSAVLRAWKCGYPAAGVDNQRLFLPVGAYEQIRVEVLQLRAVAIETRRLQVHVQQLARLQRACLGVVSVVQTLLELRGGMRSEEQEE